MRLTLLFLCAFGLAGCASKGVFGTEPAAAGTRPTNFMQAISTHMERGLKDPDSVKALKIGQPELTSCQVGVYGRYHAWRVPVSYNAKNSFGAYVGLRQYYYWFQSESFRGVTREAGFCSEAAGWPRQ